MLYNFVTLVLIIYFKTFYKLTIIGEENIPASGAVIICPNHISNFDPPLVASASRKIRSISFMAKSELFKFKLLSRALHSLGAFPVKRGEADRNALKTSLEILRNDGCLGIFPEGTRRKIGNTEGFSSGATSLALKSNAPIIPVSIKGDYKLFKPLTITFGSPSNLDEFKGEKLSTDIARKAMKVVTDDILKNL